MPLECYQYRFTKDSTEKENEKPCSGSFEDCRQVITCRPTDNCYTHAQIVDSRPDNTTNLPKISILSAGCYPNQAGSTTECKNDCIGYVHSSSKLVCCCIADRCNSKLIPIPMPMTTTPGPPGPASHQNHGFSYSFVIFLMFALATLIVGTYFRSRAYKFRRKSTSSSLGSGLNDLEGQNVQKSANNTKASNLNATEMSEFRNNNNVAVLMPLRQPLEANNHHAGGNGRQSRINDTFNGNNGNNHLNEISPNNGRMNQNHHEAVLDQQRQHDLVYSRMIDLTNIELFEIIGSGRFGRVHRAMLREKCSVIQNGTSAQSKDTRKVENLKKDANGIAVVSDSIGGEARTEHDTHIEENQVKQTNERQENLNQNVIEVAVKIIPTKERQSWQNELEIYTSARTKHTNVLDFHGWCVSPETNCHWLCLEYASKGSLHHFLKEHTVTWNEFLIIVLGIVRGLSHLHDANVVHRDFKSKNVLLRHDLTPCITDFGVAAIMDTDVGSQQKKFLQVGTPRYMSPEILECSIVFGVKNFMKIDIYAAALVIWELLSRCYPLPVVINKSPKQGFEAISAGCEANDSSMNNSTELNTSLNSSGRPDEQAAYQSAQMMSAAYYSNPLEQTPPSAKQARNWPDDGPTPYRLPFEEFVGPDPDIDTMRNIVCRERRRPPIRQEWRFHPIEPISRSLVESWEYDEDARVSATCFVERIERLCSSGGGGSSSAGAQLK